VNSIHARRFVRAPCPRAPNMCVGRRRGENGHGATKGRFIIGPLCQAPFAHLRRTTRNRTRSHKIAHDAQQNLFDRVLQIDYWRMVMSNVPQLFAVTVRAGRYFCVAGDLPPIARSVAATTASIHHCSQKAPFYALPSTAGKIDKSKSGYFGQNEAT